jgi:hypothetical protein
LKTFIPIDKLEIFLDNYDSTKSDAELRQLRNEVASLRGNLKQKQQKRQQTATITTTTTNTTTDASIDDTKISRNQLKMKKKLAEQENELTLKSSRLKLIVRYNPFLPMIKSTKTNILLTNNNKQTLPQSLSTTTLTSTITNDNQQSEPNYSWTTLPSALATAAMLTASTFSTQPPHLTSSTTTLTTTTTTSTTSTGNDSILFNQIYKPSLMPTQSSHLSNSLSSSSSSLTNSSSIEQYVFLFTSDFERNAWVEEINTAIYAFKFRKAGSRSSLEQNDIENRIFLLKKAEDPPKVVTSCCTGTLELLIKSTEQLAQSNRVFVAVELKSCGSYLQVAQTKSTPLTLSPVWNEKFNLELQSVDALRIILYYHQSDSEGGSAIAISSQEVRIGSESVNLNKIASIKLQNGLQVHLEIKFLSPKKTITRRRTRHRNDIFGGNLLDLLEREKATIPRILKDCVEVIETRGIEEMGIYRVSSVVSEVQKIKELYSKSPASALEELRRKSPHLAANVLKLYLRELPDPLFTSQLYHRFMKDLDCSVLEFRLSELCRTFSDLPKSNKTIIVFLLNHLLK